ncbi:hypothetical protein Tco_1496186, partial [Tanacetum coccineum]
FLSRESADTEGGGSPSISINTKTPATYVEPLNIVDPSQLKNHKVNVPLKVAGKWKPAAPGPSNRDTRKKTQKVMPQGSKAIKEPSDLLDVDSDPDIHVWKKIYDMHDKPYMRPVVLDNVMNRRTCELMSTHSEARAACNTIRERKRKKEKEYAELEA